VVADATEVAVGAELEAGDGEPAGEARDEA
jgi:hypothetical protein